MQYYSGTVGAAIFIASVENPRPLAAGMIERIMLVCERWLAP